MTHERLAMQILLATPTGIGRLSTRWTDYNSDFARSRHGVETAEPLYLRLRLTVSYFKSSYRAASPATLSRGKAGKKIDE